MGKARTGTTISQEMVDRITEKAAAVAAETGGGRGKSQI